MPWSRYVLLSVVSKGLLGIVLLANILLVSGDIDETLGSTSPSSEIVSDDPFCSAMTR